MGLVSSFPALLPPPHAGHTLTSMSPGCCLNSTESSVPHLAETNSRRGTVHGSSGTALLVLVTPEGTLFKVNCIIKNWLTEASVWLRDIIVTETFRQHPTRFPCPRGLRYNLSEPSCFSHCNCINQHHFIWETICSLTALLDAEDRGLNYKGQNFWQPNAPFWLVAVSNCINQHLVVPLELFSKYIELKNTSFH